MPQWCGYGPGTNNPLLDPRKHHKVDKRKISGNISVQFCSFRLRLFTYPRAIFEPINDNFVLTDMLLGRESFVWVLNFYSLEVFNDT